MKALRDVRDAVSDYLIRDEPEGKPKKRLVSEPWFIDRLSLADGELVVEGWALPSTMRVLKTSTAFTLNGRPFDQAFVDVPRPDVAKAFWQRDSAELCGFTLKASRSHDQLFPRPFLEIAYANSQVRLPARLAHTWFSADPRAEAALPSPEQRFRVIGNADAAGFLLTGATDFMRLARAVEAVTGKAFAQYSRVLDWGSGCGRIARYAAKARNGSLVGCDIDEDNVLWCARNLPGEYAFTGMQPPLPFPDGHFDLVYGLSVFTHFREPLQDAWLEELRRVVRPGGIVMVTTHGRTAIDFGGLAPVEYIAMVKAVESNGLFLASKNDQLDGAVQGADEYVNVFHSTSYVRAHWSKWFSIRAIVPGFIFTHDLVIMERR
jgi:SAM-dependent methyltransferase